MTSAKNRRERQNYNPRICETRFNDFGLKLLHALVLGSTNASMFQFIYSDNLPVKSPGKVHSGGIINISTMTMTPAKDRSDAEF